MEIFYSLNTDDSQTKLVASYGIWPGKEEVTVEPTTAFQVKKVLLV